MKIALPELCLVVLVGPSGCGKSTFARKHFKPTEVLSSDYFRGLVSDDENNQAATKDAFEALQFVASKRLAAGRLTVIDATNVQEEARKPLLALAREHDVLAAAVVLKLPEDLCLARNKQRPDRDFGPHVVRMQSSQLRRSLRGLEREGFRHVYVLETPEQVEAATVERQPLWNDRKWDAGPFDIIGDVHGCYDELVELLEKLGYAVACKDPAPLLPLPSVGEGGGEGGARDVELRGFASSTATFTPHPNPLPQGERGPEGALSVTAPSARKAVFLGDLVDRGPKTPQVLRLVMRMVADGAALCVPGNHDVKLVRALRGRNVETKHGLAESLEQLGAETPEFRDRVANFLDGLIGHYVLDGGRLVVAHAGLNERYIGRASRRVREFALYGETTGETDDFGLPVRHDWAGEYRGRASVVYGHTPVPEADWLNNTINVDTGCVFGGKLTALRWPERELVSVPARRTYAEPRRPFLPALINAGGAGPDTLTAQQAHDEVLDLDDVLGKRIIHTRLVPSVTVRAENAAAALEVMSRFAADPRWLIYLPPTMSPVETSRLPGLLEHPAEAFAFFRGMGVPKVVCQEKHMGSRAVVVLCRDADAARRRFGVREDGAAGGGIVYTRTGRRFFDDRALEAELLRHVRDAATAAGWWEAFNSDWFCLDCELMPWSAKAQELLRNQYAAVGSAATAALPQAVEALQRAAGGAGVEGDGAKEAAALLERYREGARSAGQFVAAYRRYCWPVNSVADYRLAPFHLLASEGGVHADKDHLWHMRTLAQLVRPDGGDGADPSGVMRATATKLVDLGDPSSEEEGVRWWEGLTARGGEGMVVKPLDFIARGPRGLVQPAVKCRGREYLRIIYGPHYTMPEYLDRLRSRSLGAKRSLALREFALGVEALERFVRREPLRRVHECVFGVLAMESEPVDPRL